MRTRPQQMSHQLGVDIGYTRRHGRIECIVLFVLERMRLSIGKYGKTAVLQGHIARTAAQKWTVMENDNRYNSSLVQQIVIAHFKDLSDRDLKVIADDEQFQSDMNLFGDMCDKVDWENFYQTLREWRRCNDEID